MSRNRSFNPVKQLLALAALSGILVSFAACNGSEAGAINEIDKDNSLSLDVETFKDLPNCTSVREGMEAYVSEDATTYVCMDAKWIKLSKDSKKENEVESSSSDGFDGDDLGYEDEDKDEGKCSSSRGKVKQSSSSSEEASSSSEKNSGGTVSKVPLAASANVSYASAMYSSWQAYHFTTMEDESVYYPTIASDYGVVFTDAYRPAGRVIWSAATGSLKNDCSVEETDRTAMKYRACTVSEGIGYGMLLAYFEGDASTFDALWNYTRGMKAYYNTKLMPWLTRSFHYKRIDVSSATDADIDIATALILMYHKTKKADYLADALTIVNAIWDQEIQQSDLMIYPGNTSMWKEDPIYNLSYFSPVAIRLFAGVDVSHNWNGVLDAMYTYMARVQSAGTGVFPDWSDASGAAKKPSNGAAEKTYWLFDKESVRIPWRIAWDYYWYQDARAKTILDKLNMFITDPSRSGGDPSSAALATSYSWNLSVGADKNGSLVVPSHWLAAWCLTGISGNASWLNSCTTAVNAKMLTNGTSSYYIDILLVTFSQLLNGLYVRPY